MMGEVRNSLKRLWGIGGGKSMPIAIGLTTLVTYLFFVGMVIRYANEVPPIVLLFVLLGVLMVIQPILLHGVIAGEREKRSLDMLLVAPVTTPQIVIAKLFRAFGIFATAFTALVVPTLIVLLVQSFARPGQFGLDSNSLPNSVVFAFSIVIIVAAAYANAAITILISTLSKSLASSMMANVGVHFFVLVIVPGFLTILSSGLVVMLAVPSSQNYLVPAIALNPFVTLAYLANAGSSPGAQFLPVYIAIIHSLIWTVVGFIALFAAMLRLEKERTA